MRSENPPVPHLMAFSQHIAITGARGRLAPSLIRALKGCHITPFSRTPAKAVRDTRELPRLLSDFDAVLHLGWSTMPLVSEQNPGAEEQADLPFVRELMQAASEQRHDPQVIFFSTAAVYGNTGPAPATEETPCRPLGRYAACKLAAEQILAGTPGACNLRITNVFGEFKSDKPQGIVPVLYRACHTGSPVTIWGDGAATKDYLYLDDLAEALRAVLELRLTGTYNVSSGKSLSLLEIIRLVEEATGRTLQRTHTAHYPWDVEFSAVSSDRLTRATGWRAAHDPASTISAIMADR